jgi:hypothetical protein
MAFPETLLPIKVELLLGTSWTDITSYVQRRSGLVQITRGRSDEGGQVDRGTLSLTLDNRDGSNTPIRVSVATGDVALYGHVEQDQAGAVDSVALSITGDIDVRVEYDPGNWRGEIVLVGKYGSAGQESWFLGLTSGFPYLVWSTDGTVGGEEFAVATEPVPIPGAGRAALRVTLDVNNGASGRTTTFYTSDSISGSWTQLGDVVTESGTTSIFDSTSAVRVGYTAGVRIYAAEIRSGIGGTVVASPDFTAQSEGATSFNDAQGNNWQTLGAAEITARRFRFAGEVSEWPPRWDGTGSDVYTPITASGILRRLGGRGAQPLESAAYRGALTSASLVAYWPCEDEDGAAEISPALAHPGMTIIGEPDLASYEGFAGSKPIPVLNDSEWRGSVPKYSVTGETQVRWLMHVPSGGAETGETVLLVYGTGSVRRWEVYYTTASGGSLGVRAFDAGGGSLHDPGAVALAVNGLNLMVSLELTQDGSDVDYTLAIVEPGESVGTATTGTVTGQTVGRVGTVVVSPGGGLEDVAIGHIAVHASIASIFEFGGELSGYIGETAGRRIERLLDEEGLTFRYVGDLDDTVMMGVQRPDTLIALLRECADADAGMLYEPREVLGVGYRTRTSLYSKSAAVELDYSAGELSPPLEPTDDDQGTVNDLTVSREGGGSVRAVQEAGPLSVTAVGRYTGSQTVNLAYDLMLFDAASWRLNLGTVDETRYPTLTVDLSRTAITGDAALTARIVRCDVGDLVTVDNPPAWLPPEAIRQIVQGYAEVLAQKEWAITWNCSPAAPYDVAVYSEARYGPFSTVTAEALDTTETGVDISTPTGPLWDTSASGFDIVIGGERMTVSAVGSPTGTAQTLTVVRSVNGVVKSHDSGAAVELFQQTVYGL